MGFSCCFILFCSGADGLYAISSISGLWVYEPICGLYGKGCLG